MTNIISLLMKNFKYVTFLKHERIFLGSERFGTPKLGKKLTKR